MALSDVRDDLKSVLDHVEGLLADAASVPAVDHLAAAIAEAGLGPIGGELAKAILADLASRKDMLDPPSDAKMAEAPADPTNGADTSAATPPDPVLTPPDHVPPAPDGQIRV